MIDSWTSHQWAIALIALLTLLFGSGWVWRFLSKRSRKNQQNPAPISNQTLSNPPPINIGGRRLSEVMKISVGDFVDVKWGHEDIRISVHALGRDTIHHRPGFQREEVTAEIEMSVGGGLVFGGEATVPAGVNRFRLPQMQFRQEESYSMYRFHGEENYAFFMRLFVEHINPVGGIVTVNFFALRN